MVAWIAVHLIAGGRAGEQHVGHQGGGVGPEGGQPDVERHRGHGQEQDVVGQTRHYSADTEGLITTCRQHSRLSRVLKLTGQQTVGNL